MLVPTIYDLVDSSDIGGSPGKLHLSVINIDDVFRVLVSKGVKEIQITRHDMLVVVSFYLMNLGGSNCGKCHQSEQAKVMQSGKIKALWGVKLKLTD